MKYWVQIQGLDVAPGMVIRGQLEDRYDYGPTEDTAVLVETVERAVSGIHVGAVSARETRYRLRVWPDQYVWQQREDEPRDK